MDEQSIHFGFIEESQPLILDPSFAVPFEEDERDPRTFFLDLDYVEEMWRMFRKVNGEYKLFPSNLAHVPWKVACASRHQRICIPLAS